MLKTNSTSKPSFQAILSALSAGKIFPERKNFTQHGFFFSKKISVDMMADYALSEAEAEKARKKNSSGFTKHENQIKCS